MTATELSRKALMERTTVLQTFFGDVITFNSTGETYLRTMEGHCDDEHFYGSLTESQVQGAIMLHQAEEIA